MKKPAFTFSKQYKLILLAVLLIAILAGCGPSRAPLDPGSLTFFEHYFVYPFSLLIKKIASIFGGSYGLSIISITVVIRLILMPFMVKQTKSSLDMKAKMDLLKPELDELKKKYANKRDPESQQKQQAEMMEIYKKHNMNPLAGVAGCLPLLIQMPVLLGFYYAIIRTPEIAKHPFLWFSLGHTDIIMMIIAVIIYFLQYRVSLIGMDETQKKQMAVMGLISPIMIGVISLNAPAALPLYWATGGLFLVIQTIVVKKKYYAE
ncbi:membrane protein insertase YidC [Aciduricibacillus chroicocephali]|uniref:Membrane protein insertase YidC n=1 Tax=Aciduricibacillus chroicocephali TaxID=3054939 RepID=A0ABY9KX88_9BACI|nr:membrane protein insertase YidC [Bacillaceae bacterium 44XB]